MQKVECRSGLPLLLDDFCASCPYHSCDESTMIMIPIESWSKHEYCSSPGILYMGTLVGSAPSTIHYSMFVGCTNITTATNNLTILHFHITFLGWTTKNVHGIFAHIQWYMIHYSGMSFTFFIPQQRKLMGSLAQNSSGVHWCRRRVRFNEVPKRFRVRFNRVPEKVPEKVGEALVQSQVRFNRVPEKVPLKVWEALVQRSGSTGFRRRSGRLWCSAWPGSTAFQRRFRWRSGRLWCKATSGSTGFRRRFQKRFRRRSGRLWCRGQE